MKYITVQQFRFLYFYQDKSNIYVQSRTSSSMINFVLSITILQNWNKYNPEVTELFHLKRKYDRHTDERTPTFTLPCNTFHLYMLSWTYWLYAMLFTFICFSELPYCKQYFSPLYVAVNLLIVCNTFHHHHWPNNPHSFVSVNKIKHDN